MSILLNKIYNIQWMKFNKIAPFLLVVAILYLCWKLASLFWLIIAPPQAVQMSVVELGSQQASIPNIASFALFSESAGNAADQNLNIVLQGVVLGSSNQLSSAVIFVNDVAERYRVGDSIASTSYQLAEVYWDRVVLITSSGVRKEIKFKGIENGLYQPMIPENTSTNIVTMTPEQNNTGQVIHQAIENLQEDKEAYLNDMGVKASADGGYEVTTKTPSVLKNKLRLQNGDKVLSLNGQTVGQGNNEADLLERAKQEGRVKLEVKRGDQVITIQQNFE